MLNQRIGRSPAGFRSMHLLGWALHVGIQSRKQQTVLLPRILLGQDNSLHRFQQFYSCLLVAVWPSLSSLEDLFLVDSERKRPCHLSYKDIFSYIYRFSVCNAPLKQFIRVNSGRRYCTSANVRPFYLVVSRRNLFTAEKPSFQRIRQGINPLQLFRFVRFQYFLHFFSLNSLITRPGHLPTECLDLTTLHKTKLP